MRRLATGALALLTVTASSGLTAPVKPDPPIVCEACTGWNAPHEPFKVFGNTYYVGPAGVGSVLIVSDKGLILLDGGLPQSAAVIDTNIRKLGFKTEEIRLIVNSHAHYDHAGGIAALQRASGATVAASASGAQALERGQCTEDDPQFTSGTDANRFPPVPKVQVAADGESFSVGNVAITPHLTPGHTPGSTTWTWQSCEANRCLNVVYADSLNPVSLTGFRFTGDATRPSRVEAFRGSIATVAALPCDILLAVHPAMVHMDDKVARRAASPAADPLIDPGACRAYAADATGKLDRRVAEESLGSPAPPTP